MLIVNLLNMLKSAKVKCDRQDQNVFNNAKSLMLWNKYLMSALGVWPGNPNDFIFIIIFCYYCYHLFLDYAALFYALKSFHSFKIIGAIMENVTLVQIFLRLYTMRRYNKEYGEIIDEFSQDFSTKNYKNEAEKSIFLSYNSRSKFFIKIVVASLGVTAILYFTKPVVRQLS